ncbi:glycosyl hydrolase family 28-related protein [Saccharibacillus sp. CPCC 101409]|uniref:glycosyl hydrolase family 28-related protein n=1 Tax=Saccharibacillus sp. CPCC 101409 TaxID=3058041 RepID=UPI002673559C|nr:right-handed parallel beta-helix repeat-containing protein [Saccharibacillus sp. CPCC 101409]MDO3412999.1 glycosyl hydrolase family 28-related protein [Saccharibacillus sp. CPCC 101409]
MNKKTMRQGLKVTALAAFSAVLIGQGFGAGLGTFPTSRAYAAEASAIPQPAGSLSVKSYGAVGNGKTDSLKAFQKTIQAAKKQGKTVYVPAGNYALSDRLALDGVKLSGAGSEKTILTSTNPESGSIDLRGKNSSLKNLAHVYQTTGTRDGSDSKNSVTVLGASNFVIQNVRIVGAGTAGILVRDGASDGVISGNVVKSTKADGIHITGGSKRITVANNVVKKTGDDTIAVVSYLKDSAAVSQVSIRGNSVGYGAKARGISVVGGNGIAIDKNTINNTEMAGIYIAVESNWGTRDVKNVTVSGNTVIGTGTREDGDHPNVLVFADSGSIDEVSFTGNTISNSANAGVGVWGNGNIGDIYFTSNQVKNSANNATIFKSGEIHSQSNSGF